MTDHESDWLIEFDHEYDDGFIVRKRGVDASPLVVKKYGLEPDEVMAFTCHQRAHKALTAFHFHPDFPDADRRAYMHRHEEGHAVAVGVGSRLAQMRVMRRRALVRGVSGLGRSVALQLQSAALFLAAGGSITR